MLILSDLVAQIDVLVSFASVAASAPTKYVRPKLFSKGLYIFETTHPISSKIIIAHPTAASAEK